MTPSSSKVQRAIMIAADASDFASAGEARFRVPGPMAAALQDASQSRPVTAFVVDSEADSVFRGIIDSPPRSDRVSVILEEELDGSVKTFLASRGYTRLFRPRTMWMATERARLPTLALPADKGMRAFVVPDDAMSEEPESSVEASESEEEAESSEAESSEAESSEAESSEAESSEAESSEAESSEAESSEEASEDESLARSADGTATRPYPVRPSPDKDYEAAQLRRRVKLEYEERVRAHLFRTEEMRAEMLASAPRPPTLWEDLMAGESWPSLSLLAFLAGAYMATLGYHAAGPAAGGALFLSNRSFS